MSTKDFLEKDYYKILGVAKDASADEIKKSYRKLARKYHPDANKGNQASEERFKEISEAYNVLSDEKRRKEYDEARSLFGSGGIRMPGSAGGGQGGFDLGDLFGGTPGSTGGRLGDLLGGVFGGAARPRPGRGAARTSRPRRRCPSGTRSTASRCRCGWPARDRARPAWAPAPRPEPCRGSAPPARAPARPARTWANFAFSEPCRTCRGRGLVVDDPCPVCSGSGRAMSTRTIQARIPAGVGDGQRIKLKGKGAPGERGGPAGDLYVRVHVSPASGVRPVRPQPDDHRARSPFPRQRWARKSRCRPIAPCR